MNVTLLFLLLMTFNLSCVMKRGEVPPDFSIRIEETPSQPQPGISGYAMEIRHQSNSTDKQAFEMMESDGSKSHVIMIRYSDVLKLYREVIDRKILRMKERYSDMNVLDGSTFDLQLEMNGRKKRILLRNTTPPQLHGFFTIIKEMKQAG